MPTSISVGNTDFREVARSLTVNRVAIDSLTVTLRGRSSALLAAWNTYDPGKRDSVYSNMYLESKSFTDQGPVSEITLNYSGIAGAEPDAEGENSITLQSVSLTTDEGENVTFSYFAQSSTTRWIAKGRIPKEPRYRGQPPSSIPTEQLFNPSPPDYSGSIAGQYEPVQRMTSFTRSQVAPQVWVVTETWETMIEATPAT
jgi:hypothetical protein